MLKYIQYDSSQARCETCIVTSHKENTWISRVQESKSFQEHQLYSRRLTRVRVPVPLENWDILFYRESSERRGGGGSFMKLPRRSGCSESGYFELRVSTLSVRSFAPGTSKLLLKLLTIRRSQIKIRAFFVEVEIVPRVEAALLGFIAS